MSAYIRKKVKSKRKEVTIVSVKLGYLFVNQSIQQGLNEPKYPEAPAKYNFDYEIADAHSDDYN